MALNTGEQYSGGMVRDVDGRQVVGVDTSNGGQGSGAAGYPTGSVPVQASTGNLAAAAGTATLPAAAGKFTYIQGFDITGSGATAASVVSVTVTGLASTLTYLVTVPAGVTTTVTPLTVRFQAPIPASAVNTAIVVNIPSFGAGNTNAAANAVGFQV